MPNKSRETGLSRISKQGRHYIEVRFFHKGVEYFNRFEIINREVKKATTQATTWKAKTKERLNVVSSKDESKTLNKALHMLNMCVIQLEQYSENDLIINGLTGEDITIQSVKEFLEDNTEK